MDAERLPGWLDGFATRHGGARAHATASGLTVSGTDGASAEVELPFLPWVAPGASSADSAPDPSAAATSAPDPSVPDPSMAALAAAALAHVRIERTLLVLLVRRGGYGVGVLRVGAGTDDVLASKVGGAYVQSRTAAGGWSQQRFARRRDNQVSDLVGRAVEVAVRLLVPASSRATVGAPAWLVTGGDAPLVDRALTDPRLAALNRVPRTARLTVADPRAAVVAQVGHDLRRLRIGLADPDPAP